MVRLQTKCDIIQEGAGFIPPYNTTAYNNAGSVNFTATFNFSTYCPVVTYEDDCRCWDYTGQSVDGVYVIIYTINNISMVDDGTRLDICAHFSDGLKCFPPAYLSVKGMSALSMHVIKFRDVLEPFFYVIMVESGISIHCVMKEDDDNK